MLIAMSLLLILLSAVLILAVLLQPGKGDMLTSSMGLTNQFNSVLGAKKTMDMLAKITIGLAVVIFLLSIATNKFLLNTSGTSVRKAATEGMVAPAVPQTPVTPVAPAPPAEKK